MCLRDDFRLFTEQLTARERKGPRLSRIVSQTFIQSASRPAPFKRALIRDRHGKRLTFSNTGNLVSVRTYGFKIADYVLSNATRLCFAFKGRFRFASNRD